MEKALEMCTLCGAQKRELFINNNSWNVYRFSSCGLGFLIRDLLKTKLNNFIAASISPVAMRAAFILIPLNLAKGSMGKPSYSFY
jgi:hypothetical protein